MLSSHDLLGLAVMTKSGETLGRVVDFSIDQDSQSILSYDVKQGGLKGMLGRHFLVHRSQVISLTSQKMIVDDAVAQSRKEMDAIPAIKPLENPSITAPFSQK